MLAERLAGREDPVVEQLFRAEAPALRRDSAIYRLLTGPSVCLPGELEAIVRQPYFSGYWDRYDIRLFGFGPQGDVRCATDLEPPRSFGDGTTIFPSGVSDMPNLFITLSLPALFPSLFLLLPILLLGLLLHLPLLLLPSILATALLRYLPPPPPPFLSYFSFPFFSCPF